MSINRVLPPLRNKPYGGAWSVHDPETLSLINLIEPNKGNRTEFLNDYKNWISKGKNINAWEHFANLDFCAGTTESFAHFYYRHLGKRLRLYNGEYFYHWQVARNYFKDSLEITEGALRKGDVVVMSCPFSGTGNLPNNFYEVLETCTNLSIPVMLDLAYTNISSLSELNLDYRCIEEVTTSLSKYFPVEHNRIGIRLRRNFFDDALFAYNENEYVNHYSINIGHSLIKKFDNSWLLKKYQPQQEKICNKLGIEKSNCVIFGLAPQGKFDEYSRGGALNRLCFSRFWDGRIDVGKN